MKWSKGLDIDDFILSKTSESAKSISSSKVTASVPGVGLEDCRHRAVVMQLTWMPEDSSTVFVTTSLTEAASSESELYVWVMLNASPTVDVSVVKSVKAFSIVTASMVAETVVAVTVAAAVDVTAVVVKGIA